MKEITEKLILTKDIKLMEEYINEKSDSENHVTVKSKINHISDLI